MALWETRRIRRSLSGKDRNAVDLHEPLLHGQPGYGQEVISGIESRVRIPSTQVFEGLVARVTDPVDT